MGSYCIEQGAQFGALWWPWGWDGGGVREAQEGEELCIHRADSFSVQWRLTQHCKAIILQLKKIQVAP